MDRTGDTGKDPARRGDGADDGAGDDAAVDLTALSFAKAMERLEEVVRRLESGDVSLEQSLALFQEGVALSRHLGQRLDQAEARIERLLEAAAGDAPATAPLQPLEQEE